MPDSIEVSAKNVNDAIALALQRLAKSQSDVNIEILTEGSRGILGIGAEDARVRVTVRPVAAPPPVAPPIRPAARAAKPAVEPPTQPAPRRTARRSPQTVKESAPRATPEAAPRAAPDAAPDAVKEVTLVEDVALDVPAETAAVAKEVVEDLLRLMGLRGKVTLRGLEPRGVRTPDDGTPTCTADVMGDDLAVLIGRRGENLSALQYITNMIVAKRTSSNVRVVVDVEHYLVRRYESLRGLAQRMAERVQQGKSPITLEPMPPHERRIVHMTLADHGAVTTFSIGEGDERRVVISPKK